MKKTRLFLAAAVVACAPLGMPAWGQADLPPVNAATEKVFGQLGAQPGVRQAMDFIKADDERTLREQIELTEIPAPPFKESVRAADYLRRLKALGLADARIDAEGNVIATRRGAGGGPVLVVSAHLDTVFPEGTDVKVKVKDNRYAAPGIYDDGRGLATLLGVVRALNHANLKTVGDIVFMGTVGEEELGDLRGVKAFFRDTRGVDGFISFDGVDISRVVNAATGSRRWRIVYTGPGGHSFSAFGLPSATHALGRAIAKISEVRTTENPKTTFTVGTLKGGTSVNAIAAEAELGLDMRSNSAAELKKLEEQILALAREAADDENKRWGKPDTIKVEFKLVGDRPAGAGAPDAPMLHAARKAIASVGGEVKSVMASSTDSNLPISLGIPALTLGSGGVGGGSHGPGEWYSPVNAWLGPQSQLLTILSLVGVDGVSQPLLAKR
ncbi:M20/M25/M40 family metallo-hydrolase [Ramlibacter tataouinensis]|uniref:Glutamate carboxypeptidase n=1 Tax=Ramlibacter tataouinensis (strain ATCC BAA-407 / DSM 14655 / LMG 21543 / TTB310) TaxID=365046 RepID=F5Y1Y6_RAMTT|nr:M20/M25/M40 family metallo-hydrolase [Ramlibacter tataouinensis]AEG93570.1 Glutamate carboxypeptidase [Ramlibacter tataouinensis TTB310]